MSAGEQRELPQAPEGEAMPRDEAAERAVLGAMMLSKDRVYEVAEILTAEDFYSPRNEAVFQAILAVADKGEKPDAITVGDQVTRMGKTQVVGPTYPFELQSAALTASAAVHYAGIVRDRAVQRRGIEVAMGAKEKFYAGEGDLPALIEQVRTDFEGVASQVMVKPPTMSDLFEQAAEELQRKPDFIPTPWPELNELINGFLPGGLYIFAGRSGDGKALSLDTVIPTPEGNTTMGEVKVGDTVFAADGTPTRVVLATEVKYGHDCFEVEFDDGTSVIADADHLWETDTLAVRKAENAPVATYTAPSAHDQTWKRERRSTKTTRQIAETVTLNGRTNHSIDVADPVQTPEITLPIDPYVLGYWLGDGDTKGPTITAWKKDGQHVLDALDRAGYYHSCAPDRNTFRIRFSTTPIQNGKTRNKDSGVARLRALGLLHNKHIPEQYLRASVGQRTALLAGLLDSDGTATKRGGVNYWTTRPELARQVGELVGSLGFKYVLWSKPCKGRTPETSVAWTVRFTPNRQVFTLPRKAKRVTGETRKTTRRRYIVACRPVESVPVKCIQVDHPSHLYLVTDRFIPTHNTVALGQIALELAARGVVAFSELEMTGVELMERFIQVQARVHGGSLQRRSLTNAEWSEIARVAPGLKDLELRIDDRPGVNVQQVKGFARSVAREAGGKLAGVIVDYVGLLAPVNDKQKEEWNLGEAARQLKVFAREVKAPVILAAQLNRDSQTQRKGTKAFSQRAPVATDLAGSDKLLQHADAVIMLQRQRDEEGKSLDKVGMHVVKARQGNQGSRELLFNGQWSRIDSQQVPII